MSARLVTVSIDGLSVTLPEGFTVAAAIARVTGHVRRVPHDGASGPFCGMGYCAGCRVWIEGRLRPACQSTLAPGLRIESHG